MDPPPPKWIDRWSNWCTTSSASHVILVLELRTAAPRSLSPPSGDFPELKKNWVLSMVPLLCFLPLSSLPESLKHLQGWERRLRLSFSLVISSLEKSRDIIKKKRKKNYRPKQIFPSVCPLIQKARSVTALLHHPCSLQGLDQEVKRLLVRQLDHGVQSSGTVFQCPASSSSSPKKTKPHSQQLLINEKKDTFFSCTADWKLSFLKNISIYYRHVCERDGLLLEYFISNIYRVNMYRFHAAG